jgi:hypothetical protein
MLNDIKVINLYTTNGSKRIENIRIHDKVITHTGSVKRVLQIHIDKNNNKDTTNRNIHKLKIFNTPEINVSNNHRFLAVKYIKFNPRYTKPKWIPSDELDESCFVMIPSRNDSNEDQELDILKINYNTPYNTPKINPVQSSLIQSFNNLSLIFVKQDEKILNPKWVIDKQFYEFLGMFYGSGKLFERKLIKKENGNEEFSGGVSIRCNPQAVDRVLLCSECMFKKDVLQPQTRVFSNKGKTVVKFSSNQLYNIFNNLFAKQLPSFFYSASSDCLKHFIYGFANSVGDITINQEISLGLISLWLGKELYHLFRSVGICASLKVKTTCSSLKILRYNLDLTKIKKNYDDNRKFKFSHINANKNYLELNGSKYLRVISNKVVYDDTLMRDCCNNFYPKFVYTLDVEDDNSYALEGIIVEN